METSVGGFGRQGRLEDHNIGGNLLNGSRGLIEALGLADNPNVVFKREDLSQPDTENGLGIRHNHADRAFAVLRLDDFAWLDTTRSADRSAAHPSSFRAYLRGRTSARKLSALKTVLVNHHTDSTPATILKTTHYSPAAIHLHVGFCAHDIGGKRKRKNDRPTHRHVGIHAEQDATCGKNLGLQPFFFYFLTGHSPLGGFRLRPQRHPQIFW